MQQVRTRGRRQEAPLISAGISQDVSGLIYRGRITDMKLENYYSLAHWVEGTRLYCDAVTANESDVKARRLMFLESRSAGICV